MKKTFIAAALAAVAMSTLAQAPQVPPVLKAPLSQGLKVHKSFEGPSGLTGWVLLKTTNEPLVVFTTADGRTLMSGAVLDESGRNLVEGYVEAHAPKVDFSSFAAELAKATAIVQGDAKGKNVVYAFFDPTCPYCNLAYGSFKASLKAGTQVRWIPVAFLGQKSPGQAAALLSAADPAAAMSQHEAAFKSGGLPGVAATAEVKRQLDDNLKLFREMGFKGVPAVLYRTTDGRLDAIKGAPSPADMPKVLAGGK